jgi:hypothetical protein
MDRQLLVTLAAYPLRGLYLSWKVPPENANVWTVPLGPSWFSWSVPAAVNRPQAMTGRVFAVPEVVVIWKFALPRADDAAPAVTVCPATAARAAGAAGVAAAGLMVISPTEHAASTRLDAQAMTPLAARRYMFISFLRFVSVVPGRTLDGGLA